MNNKRDIDLENIMKKEDLEATLDRTIGFVRNCDNKASIFLGVYGIILSIILTSDGIENICSVIKLMLDKQNCCSATHVLFIILSAVSIIVGLIYMVRVLCVQVDFEAEAELESDSKIFFEHIKKNGSFSNYKEKLLDLSENELLNDIASQIYINSCIASDKYRLYRRGIIFCMWGVFSFITLWIMGVIVY